MHHQGFHPPLEHYLKMAYELEEEGIPVLRARIAERLGYSGPSVTVMVRRLVAEGYFEADERELRLSEKGHQLAEGVVRKHRLADRLLPDVIGLPWPKVHQEADLWEHVISDEAESYIVALLGNPATCAHGNLIPGSGAVPPKTRPLGLAEPGDQVRLERLTETVELDIDTLVYLDAHGFRPGTCGELKDRASDGTLTLAVNGVAMAVTPALAAQLYVSDASPRADATRSTEGGPAGVPGRDGPAGQAPSRPGGAAGPTTVGRW